MQLIGGWAPARSVAVARIGVALAILLEAPGSASTLLRLAEPEVLGAPYADWMPRVDATIALLLIGSWLASGTLFLVGWHTRIAGSALVVTLAAVLAFDQQLYSNHLYLMLLASLLLVLANAGAAHSLDARRGGRETVPAWPIRLLRVQVSMVYGFAALAKLNVTFLSGSVVASYLRRDGPLAVPADWRAIEPMLVVSVLAVCIEAFIAIGVWLPRWRPAAIVSGLALHVGITIWLTPTIPLFVFSLVMLPLYVLFIDVRRAMVVVWDDSCSFCAGWVRWFVRLDWLGALRFVPRSKLSANGLAVREEDALRALQVLTPGGRRFGAFAAVIRVAERLPVSYLWAPILRLPPIARLGERVYGRVAARRTCAVPLPAEAASAPNLARSGAGSTDS
jgi:predicted DCC family thiol-disulfide oxidoreductase YuxK